MNHAVITLDPEGISIKSPKKASLGSFRTLVREGLRAFDCVLIFVANFR